MQDESGEPFPGARVRVAHMESGVAWWLESGDDGSFRMPLVAPGDYEVLGEAIGYQPVRIRPVPVLPGRRQHVTIVLRSVELPINTVTEIEQERLTEYSRAGASQWFGPFEIAQLPEENRDIFQLGRLSSVSNDVLSTEGLPGSLSGLYIDGVPVLVSGQHPDLPPAARVANAFNLSSLSSAELLTNGIDVELSGFAGPYLSGFTRPGTERPEVRAYGDWIGGGLTASDDFDAEGISANSYRGGLVLSGSLIPDTASYVIGIEGERRELLLPSPWEIDSLNAALVEVADSFDVDIAPYTGTRLSSSDHVSGFGRLDWQITQNHSVTVRGEAGWFESGGEGQNDPGLAPQRISSLGAQIEGVDLSLGATFASRLGRVIASELRVGVDRIDRDFNPATPTATRIVDGGLGFGTDPTFPAQFEQLALHLSETLHFDLGRHLLKTGVSARLESNDNLYTFATGGQFTFAGVDEFRRLEGVFLVVDGAAPSAEFETWQIAGYVQDTWRAATGLDVILGLRYEREILDDGEIRLNTDWEALTGLRNTDVDSGIDKFSPRFAFLWNLSERGEWLVRGSAGIYHDQVSSAVFSELVALDGGVTASRGLGNLGTWPEPEANSELQGPRLTLFGPGFRPPRTGRASLGVTRSFDDGTSVMVSGSYRFTDNLPRRDDLNQPLSPSTRDQHGRAIFGNPVQQGSLLAVETGSNRRFEGFDLVSALNSDGVSRYWDVTVSVQRHFGERLNVLGSYTYSWTRDDWLSGNGGGPEEQLNPFPQGRGGEDWSDGVSDFDRPHRLVLGGQIKLPTALGGARLAGLYRFISGSPFTPGFRRGVDVNADGSGENDPAFVSPTIPSIGNLLDEWECLQDQVQKFAERNSCRAPDLHLLDIRVAAALFEFQGMPVEFVADGLNLLDSETGRRDAALLLIDRNIELVENPDGSITLPYIANPNFGEALVRQSSGRRFRFGVRVGL